MISVKTDLHTHTIVSGHAFSTFKENIDAALQMGLEALGTTEHGSAMEGAPAPVHFRSYSFLPRQIKGMTLFRGIEANIIDYDGTLDLPLKTLNKLDIVIASFHEIVLPPQDCAAHTRAWLNVIDNPAVTCLGHPARGPYPFAVDDILLKAKREHVAIEINSHTLDKPQYAANCVALAQRCLELEVPIVVNSDAHIWLDIGNHAKAVSMLNEIGFEPELVRNRTLESTLEWLRQRKF